MKLLAFLVIVCTIDGIVCAYENVDWTRNCNLRKKCPADKIVACFVSPCSTPQAIKCKPWGVEDAECIDNYCGGCFFCWVDGAGKELECES